VSFERWFEIVMWPFIAAHELGDRVFEWMTRK
jgi:hypothetical protein